MPRQIDAADRRADRLAVARAGQPARRGRSGHAPPLGRCGAHRGVRDARAGIAASAAPTSTGWWRVAGAAARSARGPRRDDRPAGPGLRPGLPRRGAALAADRLPSEAREALRADGRRLVAVLLAFLDATRPADRERWEVEAIALIGDRRARGSPTPGRAERGRRDLPPGATPAARASWRRSAGAGPSTRPSSRTCTSGRSASSTGCSSTSSRRTPRRSRHQKGDRTHGPERRAAVRLVAPVVRLRGLPHRPVARAATAVPARLGGRDALVRHLGRHGVPRRRVRLERAALPRLVPDRRDLGRGLARPRHGAPARADAVRLRLRGLARAGRALHVPRPG